MQKLLVITIFKRLLNQLCMAYTFDLFEMQNTLIKKYLLNKLSVAFHQPE